MHARARTPRMKPAPADLVDERRRPPPRLPLGVHDQSPIRETWNADRCFKIFTDSPCVW